MQECQNVCLAGKLSRSGKLLLKSVVNFLLGFCEEIQAVFWFILFCFSYINDGMFWYEAIVRIV